MESRLYDTLQSWGDCDLVMIGRTTGQVDREVSKQRAGGVCWKHEEQHQLSQEVWVFSIEAA